MPREQIKYLVYPNGKVFSLVRHRFLNPYTDHSGYQRVTIHSDDGTHRSTCIHKIVALQFVPNPENKPEVNHIDGDKLNNHYTNLEWVTKSENMRHAVQLGLVIPPKNYKKTICLISK